MYLTNLLNHYYYVSLCIEQNKVIIAELKAQLNELQTMNKRMNTHACLHTTIIHCT